MDFEKELGKQNAEDKRRRNLICELVADEMYVPMKEKELAAFMQVSKEEREDFRRLLQELVLSCLDSILVKLLVLE